MVGRVKKIYTKCHAKSAALRVLQRYALAMCITIRGRQRDARGLQLQGPAPEPMGSTAPAPRRPRRAKKAHAGGPRGGGKAEGRSGLHVAWSTTCMDSQGGVGRGVLGRCFESRAGRISRGWSTLARGNAEGGGRGGGRSTWPGRLATTGDCGGAEWTAMRGAGYGFRARGGMHAGQRSRGRPARHNARRAVCSPRSINDAFAERGSAFWGQIHAFSGLKPRRAGPAPGAGRGENLRRRRSPRSTK